MLFERRFGWVDVAADWMPVDEPPLTFAIPCCAGRHGIFCTT